MRDADVRLSLHTWLQHEHRAELGTRVIDEVDIAGLVRVDTIVLNGAFAGFEIKSENDTLRRLPRQVEIYSQVLDYATLVVAKRHLAKAKLLIPRWWGIIEAVSTPDGVHLRRVKTPTRNKTIDPLTLCALLWREEVLSELELQGSAGGIRTKPNRILWQRLAESVSSEDLRSIVRERLKARVSWRVDVPPLQNA
ncbi:sce7726 family protein [Clavibacter michiganensis]|uniref:sce7726 family protein n=1 Tax=Clavibacter michiganensis TaxID=28447 RepID=UPI0014322655|nr:sce7726 family protein [Clavibacter michiganensis]QIT12081.1 sce7726 family protein [Clavibacter michiganensis subsp. michiganensis]